MDTKTVAAGDDALFAALTDFAAQEFGTRRSDFFLRGMLKALRVHDDATALFRAEAVLFAHFRKELREALDGQPREQASIDDALRAIYGVSP